MKAKYKMMYNIGAKVRVCGKSVVLNQVFKFAEGYFCSVDLFEAVLENIISVG